MKLLITIITTVVCLAGLGLWSCRWLVVLVVLLIALKLHAQTNTAAFNSAMAQAIFNVTNAIAHPETVSINPTIQTATATGASDPVAIVGPISKSTIIKLWWPPSNLPATNAFGQTLVYCVSRCWYLLEPKSQWRGCYTGTATNYTYDSTKTDGYWPDNGQCWFEVGTAYMSMK